MGPFSTDFATPMHKTLFITTCGTSLISNNATKEDRQRLNKLANAQESNLSNDDKKFLDDKLENQKEVLFADGFEKAKELSAELNVLITHALGKMPTPNKEDEHRLIHTDTYQGRIVAELLNDYLIKKGCKSSTKQIEDLNTKSLSDFKNGISSLISWCEATLPGYKSSGYKIIFNLNGGFKSLQGFMQTLGMFYADELLYIFEGGNQLLHIPRLPIELESSVKEAIKTNLNVFRRLGIRGMTMKKDAVKTVPESFLYEMGEEVELSNWGQLVWERCKSKFYSEKILQPLGHISYSKSGKISLNNLDKSFFANYNERLDDLFLYFESNKANCLKRLDYKQLKKNPCPPSTHECDLSADKGAWRIFGHEESNTFVIDNIGRGLH